MPIAIAKPKTGGVMKFGKLKKVDLRELWSREDKEFTPWLKGNLDHLGTEIGLDLEAIKESKTEAPLNDSNFKVDILATTKNGEKIIIENQLEKTDHKHLGQTLTYMINMEAKVAVWIAKEAREEHIKVISWLNEATDKDFYLIQLESYQIDDSKPAPLFKVICEPSEEIKQLGKQKKELDETLTNKLKTDFWKKFLENNKEKTKGFSLPSPSWWTVMEKNSPHKDISLAYNIRKNKGGIIIKFKQDFKDQFFNLKKEWENELGFPLEFRKSGNAGKPSDKYELCKLFDKGGYRNPKAEWKEIQEEMVNNMIKLEKLLESFLSNQKLSNKVA